MKVKQTEAEVKEEQKKFKQRVYYFEKVKGLSHKEAVERATKPLDTIAGVLSPWKQRQLAKKKGQPQPLKLEFCPKCRLMFFGRKAGTTNMEALALDACPGCGVRYYFCE